MRHTVPFRAGSSVEHTRDLVRKAASEQFTECRAVRILVERARVRIDGPCCPEDWEPEPDLCDTLESVLPAGSTVFADWIIEQARWPTGTLLTRVLVVAALGRIVSAEELPLLVACLVHAALGEGYLLVADAVPVRPSSVLDLRSWLGSCCVSGPWDPRVEDFGSEGDQQEVLDSIYKACFPE